MNSPFEKIATTVNTLLYIIQKSGGICDFHKVFKILYFADQKHLSMYGSTILMGYVWPPYTSIQRSMRKSITPPNSKSSISLFKQQEEQIWIMTLL